MSAPASPTGLLLGPDEGHSVEIGPGMGVRFMLDGAATGGGFSLVEHPIAPRTLAAPLHTHRREDEYSYVLEGEIGLQVAEEVLVARAGDLVRKPCGIPHAFWNAADQSARVLEMISPAGFENYFAEIAPLFDADDRPIDEAAVGAVLAKYELEIDLSSIPALIERYGLTG